MAPLKNIVWVGTGNAGLPTLHKLLSATNSFTIKLLVRNPISTYTNLPSGLSSVHQVDYTNHASLVQHLRGQDAVIVFTSFEPGNALDTKQIALISAAIEAGVKYFIPSEWALDTAGIMGSGSDHHGPTLPTNYVLAPKRAVHNYLLSRAAEGKIRFAAVYPGVLIEPCFQNGNFRFDFKSHTATLPDDGINPFPASSLTSLSKAIIALFDDPSKISNRFYHIADGVLTQRDMLRIAEAETGKKWKRTSFSIEGRRQAAAENMAKGTYGSTEFRSTLTTPFFGGLQVFTRLDNEMLGVGEGVDLREEVAVLVKRYL